MTFDTLGVIQFESWVDTGEGYELLDEVAKDRAAEDGAAGNRAAEDGADAQA